MDTQGAFRLRLKKIFDSQEELKSSIAEWLDSQQNTSQLHHNNKSAIVKRVLPPNKDFHSEDNNQ